MLLECKIGPSTMLLRFTRKSRVYIVKSMMVNLLMYHAGMGHQDNTENFCHFSEVFYFLEKIKKTLMVKKIIIHTGATELHKYVG